MVAYLEANKTWRINRTAADFLEPVDLASPLTEKENALADEYYDDSEYMKFLPLGYRAYTNNPVADNPSPDGATCGWILQNCLPVRHHESHVLPLDQIV